MERVTPAAAAEIKVRPATARAPSRRRRAPPWRARLSVPWCAALAPRVCAPRLTIPGSLIRLFPAV